MAEQKRKLGLRPSVNELNEPLARLIILRLVRVGASQLGQRRT
jgi:hypothetical protein